MITTAVLAAVGGVASAAGAWMFTKISHLHHRVDKLEARTMNLENK